MRRSSSVLLIALVACVGGPGIEGPPAPQAAVVTEVRVTATEDPSRAEVVRDAESIAAIARSWAFASSGWWPSEGRELVPHYRIEFRGSSGARAIYWMGYNSDPPRFPCYSLCTGVWVAPSLASGDPDVSRYKGLADTVSFSLFRHLKLPS